MPLVIKHQLAIGKHNTGKTITDLIVWVISQNNNVNRETIQATIGVSLKTESLQASNLNDIHERVSIIIIIMLLNLNRS